MPQAVAAWVAAKATALVAAHTGSLMVAQAVYAVAYYGTQIAITVAVSAVVQAAVGTPDIETAKGSKKQGIPPRIRGYGRRKLGGYYALWEAEGSKAFDVVYICEGPIEAIDEIWSHDHVLTIDGSGFVVASPEYGGGSGDLIHIESRLGSVPETPYSNIITLLPTIWTEDHRGDGVVSLGCDYRHVKKENLMSDYPDGDPSWSITGRLACIWDPREETQDRENPATWPTASANIGQQILDFCLHPTGMAMDWATEIAPAIDHWIGEIDICDEPIPLAAGGTEPRYWGSGYYAIPADPQETLNKMLAACDGRMLKDQHGVWRLWVGKYRAPTVTLADADIADYDIEGDAQAFDAVNEIVPKYVSEPYNWTLVDTTAWRAQTAIDRIGRVVSSDLALEWSNSGPMTRRVAKASLRRQQAPLRGSLVGKLSAAEALGQRWIAVDLPDLGLPGAVLEMTGPGRLAFSRGAVELTFALADPTAWDWDAATEEAGGDLVERPPVAALDPPTIDSVTPFEASLGTVAGVRLTVVGEGPDRDDLTWFVRWRVTGTDSWNVGEVTDETAGVGFTGDSGFVASVASLDVALGYQTGGGSQLWSATSVVDTSVTPAALPPAMPTGLSAIDNGTTPDGATVQWNNGSDVTDAVVYIGGPSDAFPGTGNSGDLAATPGTTQSHNYLASAGSYRIWVTNKNAAGESDPAGPVAVTVV